MNGEKAETGVIDSDRDGDGDKYREKLILKERTKSTDRWSCRFIFLVLLQTEHNKTTE